MQGRELVKKESRAKGRNALIAASATALASFFITPWLLILGLPITLVFVYQWFKFRAVNGIKF